MYCSIRHYTNRIVQFILCKPESKKKYAQISKMKLNFKEIFKLDGSRSERETEGPPKNVKASYKNIVHKG